MRTICRVTQLAGNPASATQWVTLSEGSRNGAFP